MKKLTIVAILLSVSAQANAAKLFEKETFPLINTSVVTRHVPGTPAEEAFSVMRQCTYSTSQDDVQIKRYVRVNQQCVKILKD